MSESPRDQVAGLATKDGTAFALPNGQVIPLHPLVLHLPFEDQRIYAQSYADYFAAALKAEGPSTFVSTAMSAALHEAGHVIIATSSGFTVTWSHIWLSDAWPAPSWAGWTETSDRSVFCGIPAPVENNLIVARNVMAGYIAERVLEGDAAKEGSSIDERVAALFLTTWADIVRARAAGRKKSDFAALLFETENAVAEIIARNESQARAIARALIELAPDKLQGEALRSLIETIHPEAPLLPSPRPPGRAEARRLRQMQKLRAGGPALNA
jgi:hypothetical protein